MQKNIGKGGYINHSVCVFINRGINNDISTVRKNKSIDFYQKYAILLHHM